MTEESVLRELADFALRDYHAGQTKPLTQFVMEEAARAEARIAELIESGEADANGLLKFPDATLSGPQVCGVTGIPWPLESEEEET
jgi:hypothetical protein